MIDIFASPPVLLGVSFHTPVPGLSKEYLPDESVVVVNCAPFVEESTTVTLDTGVLVE